jgi:trans-2,3-dihydro-3-hydroxyanthranilate isomerase
MTQLRFHTLDVFTDRPYSGNPLAVVLEADGLTDEQMQTVAREFNLSETVFVQHGNASKSLARLRIFTPARELPFAGHPTIGTACLLADLLLAQASNEIEFVLEENVGPVPVTVRRAPGRPAFAQLTTARLPEYGAPAPAAAEIALALGIPPAEIITQDDKPRVASCGVPFLLVPVTDMAALSRIRLDVPRCNALLQGCGASGLFLYAREAEHDEADLRARMFAPEMGIAEDPATGGAAVALAGALAMEDPVSDGRLAWVIEQGVEMGRPSLLYTEADKRNGKVSAVRVGGHAVRITEGTLALPT